MEQAVNPGDTGNWRKLNYLEAAGGTRRLFFRLEERRFTPREVVEMNDDVNLTELLLASCAGVNRFIWTTISR